MLSEERSEPVDDAFLQFQLTSVIENAPKLTADAPSEVASYRTVITLQFLLTMSHMGLSAWCALAGNAAGMLANLLLLIVQLMMTSGLLRRYERLRRWQVLISILAIAVTPFLLAYAMF